MYTTESNNVWTLDLQLCRQDSQLDENGMWYDW